MLNLKKRIIPTALAGVMALSMAVPAFASSSNTTKVTATYSEIAIDVTVPTTAAVTINPMGMPVKLPKAADDSTDVEVATQIVTMPSAIVNRSSMDLTVGATVTGTVKGNFKFAATAWDASDETEAAKHTYNEAFVILEMKKNDAGDNLLADDGIKIDADKIATEWDEWTEKTWTGLASADDVAAAVAGTDDANDAILVLSTKAATTGKNGLVKLDAATIADGEVTVNVGSVGLFRLSGLVNENPKTAWAKADGFGATIAFTFKATKPATQAGG